MAELHQSCGHRAKWERYRLVAPTLLWQLKRGSLRIRSSVQRTTFIHTAVVSQSWLLCPIP